MNKQKIILSILIFGVVPVSLFLVTRLNEKKSVVEEFTAPQPPQLIPKKPENPTNFLREFGKSFTITPNKKVVFPDGLALSLKEINDSRCGADVNCIWAGEISGTFTVSLGNLSKSREISLGTINSKSVTLEKYTFSLLGATDHDITISVKN